MQRRALLEAAVAAGARKTVLIDQPIAAMMGLGLTGDNCLCAMIVDMGGGSTKVSVRFRNTGSWSAISHRSPDWKWIRPSWRLSATSIISASAAKRRKSLKISLGAYWDLDQAPRVAETYGLSIVSGSPVKIAVTAEDVAHAINPILYRIFKNIQDVLQRMPPALLAAIREQGIMLVGGVSQLKGIDELITRITGIALKVAERPSYVNAIGAGASLNYINAFRDLTEDLH